MTPSVWKISSVGLYPFCRKARPWSCIIRVPFYSFLRDRSNCPSEVWVLRYCFGNLFFQTKSEFPFVSGIKTSAKIPKSLKKISSNFLGRPTQRWSLCACLTCSLWVWSQPGGSEVIGHKGRHRYLIGGIRKCIQHKMLFPSFSLGVQDHIVFVGVSRVTDASCIKQKKISWCEKQLASKTSNIVLKIRARNNYSITCHGRILLHKDKGLQGINWWW